MKVARTDVLILFLVVATLTSVALGPFYYNKALLKSEGEKVFVITVRQWEFEPKEIVVKKGDKITLLLRSNDVPHGINSPALGIDEVIYPGNVTKVSFTANRSGTFEFRCSVYCGEPYPHSGAGHWLLRLTLKVLE